jgi:hypothetical protein
LKYEGPARESVPAFFMFCVHGQRMTATVSGTDAAGKAFDQVIVFDRA